MGGNPDYSTISDDELIRLFKDSDGYAFSEIFRRYRSALLQYTYKRIKDMEKSKDLIHEVFADLWEKRKSIQITGELCPFLLTVIKNRIMDYYRRKKVSQKYIDDFNAYMQSTESNTTDHLVRYKELSGKIEDEVAALPEKMRLAFKLSRKENMSRKEISDLLNIPEENVKTNIRRALKILKDKFSGPLRPFLFIILFF